SSGLLTWLWLGSSTLVYFVLGHNARLSAFEGVSLPLAVLAVRGWRRWHGSTALSTVVVILLVAPGAVYAAATVRDYVNANVVPYQLTSAEVAAFRALHALPRARTLTPPPVAPAIPA